MCDLTHLDKRCRLSPAEEHQRYKTHNNDIHDPRYQNFVKPLYEQIKQKFSQGHLGLDYGCGDGPVLSHLLTLDGYNVKLFDPFFKNDVEVFEFKYDFVYATEVIEHMFSPLEDFKKIKELIQPNGAFAVMTEFVDSQINFETWYYKNDPTHVCFFSEKSCHWVANHLKFKKFERTEKRIGWFFI